MATDLRNYEMMARTLRWCPGCDPKAENPTECLPGQCPCGRTLLTYTRFSGKSDDGRQYVGYATRYPSPVAETTGGGILTLAEAGLRPWTPIGGDGPLVGDDDIPF